MLSEFATAFLAKYPDNAITALEGLSASDLAAVIDALEPHASAPLFARMLPARAAAALAELPPARAAYILDRLELTQSMRLLLQLGDAARAAIMTELEPALAASFERALAFPPGTVGRAMLARIHSLRGSQRTAVARAHIVAGAMESAWIYVVDAALRPCGVVSLVELLRAPGESDVASIMQTAPSAVSALARIDSVRDAALAEGPELLPVVDSEGRLLGVLPKLEWTRATQFGIDSAPAPDLVSAWLAVAELFWGAGGRALAHLTERRQAGP